MKLYVIKDNVAEAFSPIFHASNDLHAKREFENQLKGNPYPGDFDLYVVGEYDQETGKIIYGETEPRWVCSGGEEMEKDILDKLEKAGLKEVKK